MVIVEQLYKFTKIIVDLKMGQFYGTSVKLVSKKMLNNVQGIWKRMENGNRNKNIAQLLNRQWSFVYLILFERNLSSYKNTFLAYLEENSQN